MRLGLNLTDEFKRENGIAFSAEVKALLLGIHPKNNEHWDPRITEYGVTTVRYNELRVDIMDVDYASKRYMRVMLLWEGHPVAELRYSADDLRSLHVQGLEGRVHFKLEK